MPTLNPRTAFFADPNMNIELPPDRLNGKLDLKLFCDFVLFDPPLAMRTLIGQPGLVMLIDLIGAGRVAVSFVAISPARLTTRAAWLRFWRTFGKPGKGLPRNGNAH